MAPTVAPSRVEPCGPRKPHSGTAGLLPSCADRYDLKQMEDTNDAQDQAAVPAQLAPGRGPAMTYSCVSAGADRGRPHA